MNRRDKIETAVKEVFPKLSPEDTLALVNNLDFNYPDDRDPWLFAKEIYCILRSEEKLRTEHLETDAAKLCVALTKGLRFVKKRYFYDSINYWKNRFTPLERI